MCGEVGGGGQFLHYCTGYGLQNLRLLYLRLSKATLQLFRVWIRICHSPQRGQESFVFFSLPEVEVGVVG